MGGLVGLDGKSEPGTWYRMQAIASTSDCAPCAKIIKRIAIKYRKERKLWSYLTIVQAYLFYGKLHLKLFVSFFLRLFVCLFSTSFSATEKFESDARVGDILIVKVKRCDIVGAYVKPLCFATRLKRDLEWLDLQLLAPVSALSRRVAVGEYLEARISSVSPVKVELLEAPPLSSSELPEYFRNGREMPRHSQFRNYVEESGMLRNPYLAETLHLPTISEYSFLDLDGIEKDRSEPAWVLRKKQNEMLADEYVVRGVEHMRSGNREAAIVVLNQALDINSKCVEALVARGAAYSTNGHYVLAEADFDRALLLEPTHTNARNYMVETLVKYASLLEVQGDVENARIKFEKVLQLKEDRRARAALAKLDKKKRSPSVEILEDQRDKSRTRKNTHRDEIEEEKKKRRRMQEEERERKRELHDNRAKLREMEEFIKALRDKK